jgi:hypothetical protein
MFTGWWAPHAQAGPNLTITVQQGGPATTIVDNGPGDLNPAINAIGFSTTVGDYMVLGTITSDNPGQASHGLLQTNFIVERLTAANVAPLSLTATQSNFTLPGSPGDTLGLNSTLAVSTFTLSAVGDSVTLQSFADIATAGMQTITSPGGTVGPFFNNAPEVPFVRGASYTLTALSQVNLAAGASVNFNTTTLTAEVSTASPPAVPEPSTFALLALGGGALAGWRRWRKRTA